jgi:hypothetical protein
MRNITYAFDLETGKVLSRVGDEIYFAVLDYDAMTPENNFEMTYKWEKYSVFSLVGFETYQWTKKIPKEIKNFHRKFWGFKELK